MSRNLDEDNYYQSSGGKVPVKWSSPEVKFAKLSFLKFMIPLIDRKKNMYTCIAKLILLFSQTV